ncbi:hypothetical protein QBC39DRAFT_330309 [Podospora conica]|nr:hypothetical protein QBC39DRAFT_330309 [Schizothecium conicum]
MHLLLLLSLLLFPLLSHAQLPRPTPHPPHRHHPRLPPPPHHPRPLRFLALGKPKGPLGFPHQRLDRVYRRAQAVQHVWLRRGGAIYWTPQTGAKEVYGGADGNKTEAAMAFEGEVVTFNTRGVGGMGGGVAGFVLGGPPAEIRVFSELVEVDNISEEDMASTCVNGLAGNGGLTGALNWLEEGRGDNEVLKAYNHEKTALTAFWTVGSSIEKDWFPGDNPYPEGRMTVKLPDSQRSKRRIFRRDDSRIITYTHFIWMEGVDNSGDHGIYHVHFDLDYVPRNILLWIILDDSRGVGEYFHSVRHTRDQSSLKINSRQRSVIFNIRMAASLIGKSAKFGM